MSILKIELYDDQTAFQPGEEVQGKASWTAEQDPQRIELRLFWFTKGKGTVDAGVVETLRFDQPMVSETRSFRFLLPAAPYSFSGSLISLVWGLELIAYPSKEMVRREIEVGPARREVKLETVVTAQGPAQRWLSIKTR